MEKHSSFLIETAANGYIVRRPHDACGMTVQSAKSVYVFPTFTDLMRWIDAHLEPPPEINSLGK